MRLLAQMNGWGRRLAVLRLLAALVVAGLLAPSLPAASHTHAHGHAVIVTAEIAPSPAPANALQDDACLVCHAHCGCHVGLPGSEVTDMLTVRAETTAALLQSDHGRLSASTSRLIRPPRA